MPSRKQAIFAAIALFLALAIGTAVFFLKADSHLPVITGTADIGGPFTLTDQSGKRITNEDFKGKFMLVFFGYTYCPDICPTELQVMTQAIELMGPAGEKIQPLFITIDPGRDTPEVLKSYVANFSPRLIGLTGTEDEIAAVAKEYHVYYKKAETGAADAYLMDHTSIVYLMDPEGLFRKHFTYSTDAKALGQELLKAIAASS